MTKSSIVAVFGLSGVGKSWLIGRYALHSPVLHVQASQLLREAKAAIYGENVTTDELRKGAVLDNQALLIRAFAHVRSTETKPIIFDGHCVVDNGAELLEIPTEVIAGLAISHLIFVEGSAKVIIERRQNDQTRVRPIRSEGELARHQRRAREICEAYSKSLVIPLTIVPAGDEEAFTDALVRGLAL